LFGKTEIVLFYENIRKINKNLFSVFPFFSVLSVVEKTKTGLGKS